jgi:hypothetical protein
LSHNEERPGIRLLPRLDDDDVLLLLLPHFLLKSQRSQEEARPGLELPHDDDGLPGFLCASHLSTESARPGLGALEAKEDGRMMRHGAIMLIGGGVGSRPGRSAAAALAIARSTDDIVDLLSSWSRKLKRAGKREMRLQLQGNKLERADDLMGCVMELGPYLLIATPPTRSVDSDWK